MNTVDLEFDRDPPDDDVLAAEYVLGVLDTPARLHAQARIAGERAFAMLVDEWERRFAPLIDEIAPVDVPAHLWPRLRARLGWTPFETAAPAAPAAARARSETRSNPWRWATGASLALAAALAVVALRRPAELPEPAPQPPVAVAPTPAPVEEERAKPVVVLAGEGGQTGWLAAVDAVRGAVTMTPVPEAVDVGDRVGELWLIPSDGVPRSLGFVSHELAHTIDVPDALQAELAAGAVLAVTLEPKAGIPHAAPTGPIVAKGEIGTI
jgi:anti-sigma-K factor RskA